MILDGLIWLALSQKIGMHRVRDLTIVNSHGCSAQGLCDCLASVDSSPTGMSAGCEKRIGTYCIKGEQCAQVGRKGEFKSHPMSLPRLQWAIHAAGEGLVVNEEHFSIHPSGVCAFYRFLRRRLPTIPFTPRGHL